METAGPTSSVIKQFRCQRVTYITRTLHLTYSTNFVGTRLHWYLTVNNWNFSYSNMLVYSFVLIRFFLGFCAFVRSFVFSFVVVVVVVV